MPPRSATPVARVRAMMQYGERFDCRWAQVRARFGEDRAGECARCDVCTWSGHVREIAWWRPSFRAGRFDFTLLAAHIRWGPTMAGRVGEIAALADWVLARTKEAGSCERDILVVGDFNAGGTSSAASQGLSARNAAPPGVEGDVGSDLARGKRYDRFLCLPPHTMCFSGRAGVLDFHCGDHRGLFPGRAMSRSSCQISDHLPLWAEARTRQRAESIDVAGASRDRLETSRGGRRVG